jgi:hypothetical protein
VTWLQAAVTAVFVLASIGTAVATLYWVSRALSGAAAGVFSPLAASVAASLVRVTERGRALGLVVGALAAGTVFGVPLDAPGSTSCCACSRTTVQGWWPATPPSTTSGQAAGRGPMRRCCRLGSPPTHLPYFALIPLVTGFLVHLMSAQCKELS